MSNDTQIAGRDRQPLDDEQGDHARSPDTTKLSDVELGRAYRKMLESHQGGLKVDFVTGLVSLPDEKNTVPLPITRYAQSFDKTIHELTPNSFGRNGIEYVRFTDVESLATRERAAGVEAGREEAAKLCDSFGHHWSGAPALAFFSCATKIRNGDFKYGDRIAEPVVNTAPTLYYMRDNHVSRRLTHDVETALNEIIEELDAGWTSGMLGSHDKRMPAAIHANYKDREGFLINARTWLGQAIATAAGIANTNGAAA
jgi:hypothetical protein